MKIFSYWQSNNRQNENYFYLLQVQKREINIIHSISFKNQPYFKKGANTQNDIHIIKAAIGRNRNINTN